LCLWQDVYFNVMACGRGARVSVLSQQPFHHWVSTEENNSETFDRDDGPNRGAGRTAAPVRTAQYGNVMSAAIGLWSDGMTPTKMPFDRFRY